MMVCNNWVRGVGEAKHGNLSFVCFGRKAIKKRGTNVRGVGLREGRSAHGALHREKETWKGKGKSARESG